jgi:hypothetical protein
VFDFSSSPTGRLPITIVLRVGKSTFANRRRCDKIGNSKQSGQNYKPGIGIGEITMYKKTTSSIFLLIACLNTAPAQTKIDNEYYPLKVGHKWTYIVNDDPKKVVEIEVEPAEVFVRKVTKDGKTSEEKFTSFLLKSTSGDKVTRDQVVVMKDGVYRLSLAGTPINPPLLFFKFPVKSGEQWPSDSVSGTTTVKGTNTATLVKSDDKKLDYWVISYNNNKAGKERIDITYWFAPGFGMVQQHLKMENHEILMKMKRFHPAQ